MNKHTRRNEFMSQFGQIHTVTHDKSIAHYFSLLNIIWQKTRQMEWSIFHQMIPSYFHLLGPNSGLNWVPIEKHKPNNHFKMVIFRFYGQTKWMLTDFGRHLKKNYFMRFFLSNSNMDLSLGYVMAITIPLSLVTKPIIKIHYIP